jgi:glutamine---fructose-6-phosphate transaminase (isomerizing)
MLNDAKEAAAHVRKLLSSDEAVYHELGKQLRHMNPHGVATIARGSSDHAASYAAYLLPMCTGKPVASIPPSIVTVLNAPLDLKKYLAIAISQSGGSPDIAATVERSKLGGALTVSIVNDVMSPVAKMTDFLLPQHAGSEGIAATKSVLCTLVALARLIGEWAHDKELLRGLGELPDVMEAAFGMGLKLDDQIMNEISSVYVLSRGLGLCTALETALKLKETCGVHAEAFSTAEVRHGPREIVNNDFLVLALALPGSGEQDVVRAAEELRAQGARVMLIDKTCVPSFREPRLSPLVYLQLLYPWLVRSSKALGHDPDQPKTLKSKVIKTI